MLLGVLGALGSFDDALWVSGNLRHPLKASGVQGLGWVDWVPRVAVGCLGSIFGIRLTRFG